MLNITYAPNDAALAEQMQQDLTRASLDLRHDFLLVLVAPESVAEDTTLRAIDRALEEGHRVIPVIIRDAELPVAIADVRPIDFRRGYNASRLIRRLKQADIEDSVHASNRRMLVIFTVVVAIMFVISLFGIISGTFLFPEAEYNNTEATINALRDQEIQPTLTLIQPNTTADAENFPATVDAAPTRIQPFLILTATALPESTEEPGD